MQKKHIVGLLIIVSFIILAIFSFNDTKISYSNFGDAAQSGKTVQISGERIPEASTNYDSDNNLFTFSLRDEENNVAEIVYSGPKPNNFDIAPFLVIKGKFENDKFMAYDILTKCPSKYEGSDPAEHNK